MSDYRNRMTYYRKLIIELIQCKPEDARFVEDLMRDNNGGTLDHLTRARFKSEARNALKSVAAVKASCPYWDPV